MKNSLINQHSFGRITFLFFSFIGIMASLLLQPKIGIYTLVKGRMSMLHPELYYAVIIILAYPCGRPYLDLGQSQRKLAPNPT